MNGRRESADWLAKPQVGTLIDFGGQLRAAKDGDGDAFALIWREFHPPLLRYLKIKAAPDAEDLAADIWHRVVRALPEFDGDEGHFRSWLYTSARNRLTDWYRGGDRRPRVVERSIFLALPAADFVDTEAEERSSTEDALALIAQLPPDQAEAVMLRVVAGLDVPSVARIMSRSAGSVRVLSHRGLRHLERLLDGDPRFDSAGADDLTRVPYGPGLMPVSIRNAGANEGALHG
jgi:RNA polymerase sigma-70 factor (ECF subfamily)